jgi:hypothetical protein
MQVLLFALCVVVFIVFVVYINTRNCANLTGFWEADDIFKADANLSDFYMYIGNKKDNVHPSYILMMDADENVIINKALPCKISMMLDQKRGVLSSDDFEDVMPAKLTMKYSMIDGVMELYSGNTMHAKFIKNNKLSHICKPTVRKAVDEIINGDDDQTETI